LEAWSGPRSEKDPDGEPLEFLLDSRIGTTFFHVYGSLGVAVLEQIR